MEPSRMFPFRRALAIDPYLLPITSLTAPVAVAVNKAAITAAGVTSYKMYNPTGYWIWYRGWNGAQSAMPAILEKGHYLPPGAVDLNTSQIPDWIAALPQVEPGCPVPVNADGVTLTTPGRLVMIYGSGL